MAKEEYSAKHSGLKLNSEMQFFLYRRTIPFLNRVGINKPLTHLLQEAYLQGVQDTLQVLDAS